MNRAYVPYLCGGVLFSLLLQARKNRKKARNKLNGGSDGLSDTELMNAFVYVVTGERMNGAGNTLRKCTAEYKSCKISSSVYIPLTDEATIAAFNENMKKKNSVLYDRATEFTNNYLSAEKLQWLVKALFETIQKDEAIGEEESFLICRDKAVTKAAFSEVVQIEFQSFLLGIRQAMVCNQ